MATAIVMCNSIKSIGIVMRIGLKTDHSNRNKQLLEINSNTNTYYVIFVNKHWIAAQGPRSLTCPEGPILCPILCPINV
jgi:hypothetical protein